MSIMPLLLLQFSNVTITPFNQSSGTLSSVQTFLKRTCNHAAEDSLPYFSDALLILSKPGDLWFFNLNSALRISAIFGGMSGTSLKKHYMKSVQIRVFFWSRENSLFGHFLHSEEMLQFTDSLDQR